MITFSELAALFVVFVCVLLIAMRMIRNEERRSTRRFNQEMQEYCDYIQTGQVGRIMTLKGYIPPDYVRLPMIEDEQTRPVAAPEFDDLEDLGDAEIHRRIESMISNTPKAFAEFIEEIEFWDESQE